MKSLFIKLFYLLNILILISPRVIGQDQKYQLGGALVAENQNIPMEYIEVLMSDLSNNVIYSTITNGNGVFEAQLNRGTYILRYREFGEILGQDTICIDGSINLGTIAIPSINKDLQEVTVVAMKKIISFDNNKLTYNVKNSPYANGFNANDVIKNIPGINPTNQDEIAIVGKENVIVLVNGRKSNLSGKALQSYLNSIPSDDISKIAIQTNPSPEFASAGNTGIINIELKNPNNLGLDGTVRTGYTQRQKSTFEEGADMSFSNKFVMLNYNIGYWNEKRMHDVINELQYNDFNKLISNESSQNSHYISQNLTTNIFLNRKMNLGFLASFNYMDEDLNSSVYQQLVGTQSSFSSEITKSDVKYKAIVISPYYEWNIDSLGKKISVNYCYNNTNNQSNSNYISENNIDLQSSLYDNNYIVNTANLNLTLPFNKCNFEAGVEYSNYNAGNYAQYNVADNFTYEETVTAVYADINKAYKTIYFKLGLRYEHTHSKGIPNEATNDFSESYGNYFPFAELTYKSNSSIVYIGYSKRINRPNMQQLNPTRSYIDMYSYMVGNPYLQPAIIDCTELRYQYKALNTAISYIHTSDALGMILKDEADAYVEQTYSNCISYNSFVGNVSYNYSHNKFNAALQLSANYNKSESSDSSLNANSLEGVSSFVACNISYLAASKVLIYVRYFYYFPGQEQFLHYKSFQNFSTGLNTAFINNKLILNLNINDLFGTYYNRNHVVYQDFVFKNRNDYDNRCVSINLTYKFGNNKLKQANVNINTKNSRLPNAK